MKREMILADILDYEMPWDLWCAWREALIPVAWLRKHGLAQSPCNSDIDETA